MKFKNKEDYLSQRATKMNKIESMMENGSAEDIQVLMNEVEAMDKAWSEQSTEMANKTALNDKLAGLQLENMSIPAINGQVIDSTNGENENDLLSSVDYRKSFMNYVVTGSEIPSQFLNANANTKTTDVGIIIPTTVVEKIIQKLEATGMILPLVTKTSYKGGVSIPKSTLKPVATWVAEGTGSDKQKMKTDATVTFSYYKLRCAVSVSFETEHVTLAVFETTLISNIVEAMTKALEQAIISGDGVGKPKGILNSTIKEGQEILIEAAGSITYKTLVEAEAALPLEYEQNAVWCMSKKTFMSFIGMVDDQKQPIARVNYGIGGKPERTLLGRTVVLCNYVSAYQKTVTEDTKIAFIFDFKDYVLNTNYQMGLKKYEDNETDDQVTKSIMLADGKVVDEGSLVVLTKQK